MKNLIIRISAVLILLGWFSICLAQTNDDKNPQYTVANSPREICPILIGETVPELILTDVNGSPFNLNAAIEQKPTILIFYRGGW